MGVFHERQISCTEFNLVQQNIPNQGCRNCNWPLHFQSISNIHNLVATSYLYLGSFFLQRSPKELHVHVHFYLKYTVRILVGWP